MHLFGYMHFSEYFLRVALKLLTYADNGGNGMFLKM